MNSSRNTQVQICLANLQSQLGKQPLSLALGDYVIYNGERINAMPYSWKMGEHVGKECIISSISPDASKYCIEGWNVFIDRASLTYVRDADVQSLSRVIAMLECDDEGEEDESDDSAQEVDVEYAMPNYPERAIVPEMPDPMPRLKSMQHDPRDHRSTQKAILAHHEAKKK